MATPSITLLEIARRLNVSKAAVSIALRGRPGVSEAMRAKIVAEAERCGYRPNPVAAELMAMVRSQRHPSGGETVAFINTFANPQLYEEIPGLMDFYTGARAHAATFGYSVEKFDAHAPKMTRNRLVNILKARGVRGVLVGPRWRTEPEVDFPWVDFSVVLVGETSYRRKLYRVCNHHTRSCVTVLEALAARGYRRIGLAVLRDDEVKHGFDYLLGVEQFNRSRGAEVTVVPWVYNDLIAREIKDWVETNQLDAVVSLQSQILDTVMILRTAAGVQVGYASLSLPPGAGWSGIEQHPDKIGAEAVNLLRNLLLSGERGEATYHRVLLVEGEWVDGSTTRPLPAAPAVVA